MMIKQMADGKWYICRRSTKGKKNINQYREWFLVKPHSQYLGRVELKLISFPNDFVGKRVRFVVEVIKREKKKPNNF